MNILHMKYALEVARAGSINKASENLLVAQPNVSRAIKELEGDLGITIFQRSAKGMQLTADGEQFIRYARKISNQIQEVESFYKQGMRKKTRFAVSVPKSAYIAHGFIEFCRTLSNDDATDIIYNEASAAQTIENVIHQDYQLGILRHNVEHTRYYETLLEEKGLAYEPLSEVTHVVVFSANSPLAGKKTLALSDLTSLTEIVLGDPLMSSMPTNDARKELPGDGAYRQTKVFDRSTQLALVKKLPDTFMWASPYHKDWLEFEGLCQCPCKEYQKVYRDILIYRKDEQLSPAVRAFIDQLHLAKAQYLD